MAVYDQSSCFFKDILETYNPSKRFDSKVLGFKVQYSDAAKRDRTTSLLLSQKVLNTTITRIVMLNIHQSKRLIAISENANWKEVDHPS